MRPQLGACPGSAGVGSLWVSTETGVRPEEAPPTSHRPRENFRPQRGPKQSLSVLAPWPCPSFSAPPNPSLTCTQGQDQVSQAWGTPLIRESPHPHEQFSEPRQGLFGRKQSYSSQRGQVRRCQL